MQAPGGRGAGCPAPLRSRLFLPLTAPSVQRTPRRASRPAVRSNIPRLPFCVNRLSAFFEKKFLFFALFFFAGGKGSVAGQERRGRLSFFSSPPPASPCGRAWDWSRARGAFGSDRGERTNGAAAERRKARPEQERGGAMIFIERKLTVLFNYGIERFYIIDK